MSIFVQIKETIIIYKQQENFEIVNSELLSPEEICFHLQFPDTRKPTVTLLFFGFLFRKSYKKNYDGVTV